MNETNENAKNRLTKTFAVIGFIVIIIFMVWLAVQIVRHAPAAFSSLASLSESVQTGQHTPDNLVIESEKNVINSEESFRVTWTDLNRSGYYAFTYDCVEGVSLETRVAGNITDIDCGDHFMLPSGTFSLDLNFTSEKERFVDVPYQVIFIKDGESEPAFADERFVTLANASIPSGGVAVDTEEEVEDEPETTEEPADDVADEEDTGGSTGATDQVYYRTVTTLVKPVSDPNGTTNLSVRFIGVGDIASNRAFRLRSTLEENEPGAIQFEVKNIGTKTSGSWRYVVELPGGDVFESNSQAPLKPNEHSILTIGFYDAGDSGRETVAAEVFGGNDTTPLNNGFRTTVRIED